MSTPEPGLHHRTDTFVLGLAAINRLPHASGAGSEIKHATSLGSPATATTRPPRGGPMQRHLRASSFAAAPESCAMKGSFVRFLPCHSNSGCRVCHLAEAAHIQGVDAKSTVMV